MARPGRSGKPVLVKAALPFPLLLQLLLLVITLCAQQGFVVEAKAKNAPAARARKEDVKFIKCGVCEEIVKQLHRQVKKKRDAIAPKKLTELEIIDITENVCNIKKHEADWLMYLDIVEDGNTLKLMEQEEEGECNTECKTIERACQEVMGDHDTDVAEFIFKGEAQRSALSKLLCKDLSKACARKPPPVPKDRVPGEPFLPKPSKDAEMAKLMRSMGDIPGAPGMEMYSRDQLMSGGADLGIGGDDDDDDDEGDEDDEALFRKAARGGKAPSRSGFLGQAEAALGRVQAGIQTAFKSATHHYNKVYRQAHRQVTKWWQGGKKGSTKAKTKRSSPSKASRSQKGSKSEL